MPSIFAKSEFLVLLVGCFLPVILWAQDSPEANEPHPWLADAPPSLARLVDIGNVKIVEDQAAVEAAGRTALTVFNFTLAYQMRFRLKDLGKDTEGKQIVRIHVDFYDVTVSLNHKVQLSKFFRPTNPWSSALLQHEFDHVAISSDPRMVAMLRSLNGRRSTLVDTVDQSADTNNAWAQKKIEESTKQLRQAVEKLVRTYYERLDEVSNHGLRGIDDRRKFFTRIYSIEDLESIDFPFIDDVRKSLDQVDSEVIRQHYVLP